METTNHLSGRLPTTVTPERYELTLTVDPERREFTGHARIEVTIAEPTTTIMLHALELAIDDAMVEVGGETLEATCDDDQRHETVTLVCPSRLPAGPASITLSYRGTLNRQLRGLYEASASYQGREERYAFTQCEATDARRIFPCFDEPAMKARFRVTAIIPSHLTALSNMPVVKKSQEGALTRVEFDETPVMSTYLFALAIARLQNREITVDGCRVAVWALPDQLRFADFALDVAAAVLPRLNAYFGLPYPYPKLDLVALPDFAMGAMENWGAIFFRDSRLLVDEALASTTTKRIVANVITHEIVHQWFGNLVTMWWWDDLWLNESFATWLAVKIVDQWKPEWNSWVEFQQEKQTPFSIDALTATRPITAHVTSTSQIEELFDALTYEKGAAVLRMIEQFLGDAVFRDGIRHYMQAHQFANASADDLWTALEEASGQPVRAVAHDWFTQPGFPLITARQCGTHERSLTLQQQRFHAQRDGATPLDQTRWNVPLTIKYEDRAGVHVQRLLFRNPTADVSLSGKGPIRWVYVNAHESGFFRSHYDPALRDALQPVVTTQLEPSERIGYLDHLWALSRAGTLSIGDFMDVLARFHGDRTRVVVQAIAHYLEMIADHLILPEDRPLVATLSMTLCEPLWNHYGWDPRPDEPLDDDESRLSRAATLWVLGRVARDRTLLDELPTRVDRYLDDPSSLDPTLATPLIRLHATQGDQVRFDQYLELYAHARTPEERDRFLVALADFPDPMLARRYLDYSLTDAVRGQDAWKPIRYLLAKAGHPDVQAETWTFMKNHWTPLREKSGSVGAMRMIQGLHHLWRSDWHADIRQFFDNPAHRVAAAERVLAQTLEFITVGVAFVDRQQTPLARWLTGRGLR